MGKSVESELREATERILESEARKKLIVAGPGTGKTHLFRKLLEAKSGGPEQNLVLTFINNLKDDLERSLGELAQVYTLHGYCQSLLYQNADLRDGLTRGFKCYPGLVSLIKKDWEWLCDSNGPEFVKAMRDLDCSPEHESFYLNRSNYYDAVDFDDSVYRAYRQLTNQRELVPSYELVLIDEFQDFNKMEAGIIDLLGERNAITIAGDDDQALYSQLRNANWDYIRSLYHNGEFEVFSLPFCMRCTEVVVKAVNDVMRNAKRYAKLGNRIEKPYQFFEPIKGEDSRQYPLIDLVTTSVQSAKANYFGRYIEEAIRAISDTDIRKADENYEPVVLVIGNKPYLPQIKKHLVDVGLIVADETDQKGDREEGLELLFENPASNLGWRIILSCGSDSISANIVRTAFERDIPLCEIIPEEERVSVLHEAEVLMDRRESSGETMEIPDGVMNIKLTSYEGSKGLAAQYVFLVAVHDGELPRNAERINDIEICKFVVGLTRMKKKCSLLLTQRFGADDRRPSLFINWIERQRYNPISVNAQYWK